MRAEDAFTWTTQGWGGKEDGDWGFKVQDEGRSMRPARKMGLRAEDALTPAQQSIYAKAKTWGFNVGTEARSANMKANREGIRAEDAAVVQDQAQGGSQNAGWGSNRFGERKHPRNHSIERRQGVRPKEETVDNINIKDYIDDRAGLVVPYGAGLPLLLALPPTKCETIGDELGIIDDLFRAARDHANPLMDMLQGWQMEEETSLREMVAVALLALQTEEYADQLYAHRAIAQTAYGRVLGRLKRVQVESKTPLEIVESYQHETSNILVAPPDGLTGEDIDDMAAALYKAAGRRVVISNDKRWLDAFPSIGSFELTMADWDDWFVWATPAS